MHVLTRPDGDNHTEKLLLKYVSKYDSAAVATFFADDSTYSRQMKKNPLRV